MKCRNCSRDAEIGKKHCTTCLDRFRKYSRTPRGKRVRKRARRKYRSTPKGRAGGVGAQARRHALELQVYGRQFRPTEPQFLAQCATWGGACVYCGGPFETIDHLVPLSREEYPVETRGALENLAPSCLSCNGHKSSRTLQEFEQWPGRLVALDRWHPELRTAFTALLGGRRTALCHDVQ